MSDAVALQYVGLEAKGPASEYTFTLRGSGGGFSEYFVTIANAAFMAHRVRYQDAPDHLFPPASPEFASGVSAHREHKES